MITKADRWIEYRRSEALTQSKQFPQSYRGLHYNFSISMRIKKRTNNLSIYYR